MTPIHTTGELEDLNSAEDLPVQEESLKDEVRPTSKQGARETPLKSLLKKPSFDKSETFSASDNDSDDDSKMSPKKVHFSDIDQVKLMSQDSLASLATSDGPDVMNFPITLCKTVMTSTPSLLVPRIVTNKTVSIKQEEIENLNVLKSSKTVRYSN